MAELSEIGQLREDLRSYHGTIKDELVELRQAIYGVAGDDTRPGINVEVQSLRAFRDASAWAWARPGP